MKQILIYADLKYIYILDKFREYLKSKNIDSNITDEQATKLLFARNIHNLFDEKTELKDFKEWKQLKFNYN